ncbi:hypothetical protein CFP65_3107 [Kitasatospora sp. MMS16-BH015]|uniref:hypothetical protein n=1 Tax=Kitasatospora sp. MMS16-BH015 TaxID=2018025 RepID=UPI000CA1A77D|nr:hypothetical protein [Kitasatospora sp. MMS16-BH015]AUG77914.1 hypothetical protein CFP65_3107 [Kitasatospora sp. MMS16-BH015]
MTRTPKPADSRSPRAGSAEPVLRRGPLPAGPAGLASDGPRPGRPWSPSAGAAEPAARPAAPLVRPTGPTGHSLRPARPGSSQAGAAGASPVGPAGAFAPRPARPGSPLVGPAELAVHGPLAAPRPHGEGELAALVGRLTAARARTVCVGHSRDEASRAAALAFAEAWGALPGRLVSAVVDWPEQAASWLRPARRLAAGQPDAWVIAAAPLGWAQLARRLRQSTDWEPARTYGFASLAQADLLTLAGPGTLEGLRGVTADGGCWEVADDALTGYPAPRQSP